MKKPPLKFIFLASFFGSMILVSYLFDLPNRFSAEALREFILEKGFWGPVVFCLLYMASAMVIFPTVLLSVQSGVIWGPFWGTIITVVASTIASVIPYLIAKYLGHDFVWKIAGGAKTRICERFFVKNGLVTILLMRFIPILPWDTVNYGAGLCGFRMFDYVVATLIGTIPASLAYNMIGDSLGEPLDPAKISIIVVIGVATFGLAFFMHKKKSTMPQKACQHL